MKNRIKSYIFLDFDGVLNTEQWQRHCRALGIPRQDVYGDVFDPGAVDNLAAILAAVPEAKVVITSSWKWEGLGKMRRLWSERNLPGGLPDITPEVAPMLTEEDFERIERGELPVQRGFEIKTYLEENGGEGSAYVILDDTAEFYPYQLPHFVCTDPRVGITAEDATRAIGILKGMAEGDNNIIDKTI